MLLSHDLCSEELFVEIWDDSSARLERLFLTFGIVLLVAVLLAVGLFCGTFIVRMCNRVYSFCTECYIITCTCIYVECDSMCYCLPLSLPPFSVVLGFASGALVVSLAGRLGGYHVGSFARLKKQQRHARFVWRTLKKDPQFEYCPANTVRR